MRGGVREGLLGEKPREDARAEPGHSEFYSGRLGTGSCLTGSGLMLSVRRGQPQARSQEDASRGWRWADYLFRGFVDKGKEGEGQATSRRALAFSCPFLTAFMARRRPRTPAPTRQSWSGWACPRLALPPPAQDNTCGFRAGSLPASPEKSLSLLSDLPPACPLTVGSW